MRYFLIYNPKAGFLRSGSKMNLLEEKIASRLNDERFSLLPTNGSGHAESLARELALKYGPECMVGVHGGDGTLSEAANGLQGTETALFLLPGGSGNDFARSIYPKGNRSSEWVLEQILNAAQTGRDPFSIEEIDLLEFTADNVSYPDSDQTHAKLHRCSANTLTCGYDSEAVVFGDKLKKRLPFLGSFRYLAAALILAFRPMHHRALVSRDGGDAALRDYAVMAICNARYYGGGFLPNPEGKINDGIMDVYTSTPLKTHHVYLLATKYKHGRGRELKILSEWHGKRLRVEALPGQRLVISNDGEAFYCSSLDIRVKEKALKLALPALMDRPQALV